ncbi:hypothetical protein ELY17_05850 [Corynebacterium sp. SY003]|uniref:hypothetical protein n=1 Tax=Corynebacterium sp. SY003 TaxID=2499164 RepID=UPI0011849FD2|nr:hypothetical protein [Corynebacterium sp. SY003]TSD91961.1 hypothetical protein ELY17_05850 [Corynebacterium sp. SY003]
MGKRDEKNSRGGGLNSSILHELKSDEEYIACLSRGEVPASGHDGTIDPSATALLALRKEILTDVPPPPTLAQLGITDASGSVSEPLAGAKSRRYRGFFSAALMGAAAATFVIAGGGLAIHSAQQDSALYGLRQVLFGDQESHEDVIQLASTLDQVRELNAAGDTEGVQRLLTQAQSIVDNLAPVDREQAKEVLEKTEQSITEQPSAVQPPQVTGAEKTNMPLPTDAPNGVVGAELPGTQPYTPSDVMVPETPTVIEPHTSAVEMAEPVAQQEVISAAVPEPQSPLTQPIELLDELRDSLAHLPDESPGDVLNPVH